MGCSFYECENCKECCCDFCYCAICDMMTICADCMETQKKNHYLYNVIYCKEKDDEFGNLDYLYLCDDCLLMDEEELNNIDEKYVNYIRAVDKSLIIEENKKEIDELNEKIGRRQKLINKALKHLGKK